MFIQLDEEEKGYLNHDQGFVLFEEIHLLILNKNERPKNFDMGVNEQQWNELWKIISDDSEELYLMNFARMLEAYEVYQYEKSYKAAMELLYADNKA